MKAKLSLFAAALLVSLSAFAQDDDPNPGTLLTGRSLSAVSDDGSYTPSFQPDFFPSGVTQAAIAEPTNSPDLQALASNLGDDPVRIYNFVHDQIAYVPYFGALKGSALTLLERSGNDFDQCALLASLLQIAGYSPAYQFGFMNIPYDASDHRDLHHWLGLTLENPNFDNTVSYFENMLGSRGWDVGPYLADATNTIGFQRIWVIVKIQGTNYYLDPSFKVSEPVSGVTNLAGACGLSSATLLSAAGGTDNGYSITGLSEGTLRAALQTCNSNLLNFLSNNLSAGSVEQVVSGSRIVSSSGSPLPTSLPFSLFTNSNYPLLSWTNQPTNFMSSISVSLGGTNKTWFTPELQGQRLSLTFSNNGLAQLWLEDALALQTTNTGRSNTVSVTLSANHPYTSWDYTHNVPVDGGYDDDSVSKGYQRTNASYAIIYSFDASTQFLQARQKKLQQYRAQGYSDSSRQVVTETLNVMGLGWMVQTRLAQILISKQLQVLPHDHHRFGRMGQESGRGYYVDAYLQRSAIFPASGYNALDVTNEYQAFDISSYFASAQEHAIIEQLQTNSITAASTIKMLELSVTNSQPIYLASTTNWQTGANVRSKLIGYGSALTTLDGIISSNSFVLLPQNATNRVAGAGSWYGSAWVQLAKPAAGRQMTMSVAGQYNGGFSSDPSATVSPPFISQSSWSQPSFISPAPVSLNAPLAADPVNMVDGTFQFSATDLSLGGAAPRGLSFTRYYSSELVNYNNAAMAPGWLHSYYFNLLPVSAPQASLGTTTPQQMAPMVVATLAAVKLYDNIHPDPKNWAVTALIAKWGVDQTINNAVSVSMGKDLVQFIKQPNGSFTPPAGVTMNLSRSGSTYSLAQRHANTFQFDANNRLTNIVDQSGRGMAFNYNTSNNVSQVTDWTNRNFTFSYSGSPTRLVSVSDSTGRNVSFTYGTNSNQQLDLISGVDTESQTNRYGYDTNHEMVAQFSPAGLVVSNIYDGSGRVLTQYTAGDLNKMWRIAALGPQTTVIDPAGGTKSYFYDSRSRQIGFQDALGNVSQKFYNGQDHVVMTVSPLTETNQSIFDANNNLIGTIDPLGYSNQYVYDSQNRLTATIDKRGQTNLFGYNSQFSLTASTNAAGDYVTYGYNPDGNLAARTDSGGTANYAYDTNGYLASISYSGISTQSFRHDAIGNLLAQTNALSFTFANQFNSRGQITNSVAPSNVVTRIAYDSAANLSACTDARGSVTSNTWSATGHLLSTLLPATPAGSAVVSNAYDARDWFSSSRDPFGKTTFSTNDAAQNLVAANDPLGRIVKVGFDADGRQTACTNGAGEITRQQYNPRGQLTNLIDSALETVNRTYDSAGNQTFLTNRNGKLWQFQFDAANRLTNTISPKGFSSSVTFNHQGLVSSAKDAKTQTAFFYYDAKGRLTNRTDSLAATSYIHDPADQLTNISETVNSQLSTLSYTFDAYGRVSAFTDALGNLIQYRYDPNGNLTNLVYPGNRVVSYAYDALNRLTNVTDWATRKTSFTYDLGGRLVLLSRPNNTQRSLNYNDDGEATNIIEQTTGGIPIALWRFAYNSNATVQWKFAAPLPPTNAMVGRTNTYDDDNRLLTFNGRSVTNDANGNMVWGPGTNNAFAAYGFDPRNRLTSFSGVTNAYDPSGNRIGLLYGTAPASYVVNPNSALPQVLMRIKGGITNYYIYGAGLLYEISETATSSITLYYHFDSRGSTVATTDGSGNVTGRIQYSAYATTIYRSTSFPDTPFLYNGRYGVQTDPNGLLYMRARFYNPLLCRFINADPSGFSGGLNFYAYAAGNPVSLVDPFGLGAIGSATAPSWIDQIAEGLGFDTSYQAGEQRQQALSGLVNAATLGVADLASSAFTGHDLAGKATDTAQATGEVLRNTASAAFLLLAVPTEGVSLEVEAELETGVGAVEGAGETATQLEFNFARNLGQNSGLVIGRGRDLAMPGALGAGEYRLGWFSVQETSGMEAEWLVNQSKLQNVMNLSLPIRDASSVQNFGGFYLNRERGMLQSAGWNYQGGYWIPPAY